MCLLNILLEFVIANLVLKILYSRATQLGQQVSPFLFLSKKITSLGSGH